MRSLTALCTVMHLNCGALEFQKEKKIITRSVNVNLWAELNEIWRARQLDS